LGSLPVDAWWIGGGILLEHQGLSPAAKPEDSLFDIP
jgi:hypothetical protein